MLVILRGQVLPDEVVNIDEVRRFFSIQRAGEAEMRHFELSTAEYDQGELPVYRERE